MKLTFLGTTSKDGGCPAVYRTDRGTLLIQGAGGHDPADLDGVRDVGPGETFVEIPEELTKFIPRETE